MKICMITPMLYPPDCSAIAIVPRLLGDYFERLGHEVSYVAFAPRSSHSILNAKNVTYIRPFFRDTRFSRFKIPVVKTVLHSFVKTCRLLKNADIVHLHSYTPLIYSSLVSSKLFRKPAVMTLYGEILDYPAGAIKPLSFFSLCVNYFLSHVIFYSHGLMNFAKEAGITPKKCSVIYPPISEKYFSGAEDESGFNFDIANVILYVKGLYPVGGAADLIKAMETVCQEIPDAVLLICGDGPLRSELEKLARALKVEKNVRFLGWVMENNLVRYYRCADVLAVTSLAESLGNPVIEALANGVPVVATSTMGTRELKNMFHADMTLVETGNIQHIAQSLIRLLKKKPRVSEETKSMIKAQFSVEAISNAYLSVYNELLGAKDRV